MYVPTLNLDFLETDSVNALSKSAIYTVIRIDAYTDSDVYMKIQSIYLLQIPGEITPKDLVRHTCVPIKQKQSEPQQPCSHADLTL